MIIRWTWQSSNAGIPKKYPKMQIWKPILASCTDSHLLLSEIWSLTFFIVNATKEIGLLRVRCSRLSFENFCIRRYADYLAAPNDRRVVSGVAVMLGNDTAAGWKIINTHKCATTAICE